MISDSLHTLGMRQQLLSDGEPAQICGVTVAVITNTEPNTFEMQDAGYLDKEPITLEVLIGSKTDTDTMITGATLCQMSLRGKLPAIHQHLVIDGINRRIMRIANQRERLLIHTIKSNIVTQPINS